VPHINLWEPCYFAKVPMVPRFILLMSTGSKKKEPRYARLCEVKVSHLQRMWAEVSSCAPHLLHSGRSDSPVRWRCLLRLLSPVRRPITALDCVLLKDRNLACAPKQGLEISSRACLWVSPRPSGSMDFLLSSFWKERLDPSKTRTLSHISLELIVIRTSNRKYNFHFSNLWLVTGCNQKCSLSSYKWHNTH